MIRKYFILEITSFLKKDIISVELPETIQTIGEKPFVHNKLKDIEFPKSVTTIGIEAFD